MMFFCKPELSLGGFVLVAMHVNQPTVKLLLFKLISFKVAGFQEPSQEALLNFQFWFTSGESTRNYHV